MAHSCPLGNISKSISIVDNKVLRKDGNGTSMIAIVKHPATHTKAMPIFYYAGCKLLVVSTLDQG